MPSGQKSTEAPPEPEIYTRAKSQLENICKDFESNEEKTTEILKRLDPFFKHFDKNILPDEKIEAMKQALLACANLTDAKQFIEEVMSILKPVLDIRESHADKFEEMQAQAMNESGGFTEINRLLSYGKSGPIIHIHAPPGKTMGNSVGNKIVLYREGMRKLAEIVNNDPEVKQVTATSHLVASHPTLFTRAGFTVADIPDEDREKHFTGESREIKMATIDRDEFLKRFLQK